jgi:hypothetical protein
MRAKPFTFKKTKRVVTIHRAISVDLTEQEAADLAELLYAGVGGGCYARAFLSELCGALRDFSKDTRPTVMVKSGEYCRLENAT